MYAWPDAELRYKVHGSEDIPWFEEVGRWLAADVSTALSLAGREPHAFHSVLDWGCGCGRVIRHLPKHLTPGVKIVGADIDKKAIEWCRKNLPFCFDECSGRPPLPYSTGQFDLVIAVSVFTHLPESMAREWAKELSRVLSQGGILVASLHGEKVAGSLDAQKQAHLKRSGFLFDDGAGFWKKWYPDWYGTTYHTKEYAINEFEKVFDVLRYSDDLMNSDHDYIVLQKRPGPVIS